MMFFVGLGATEFVAGFILGAAKEAEGNNALFIILVGLVISAALAGLFAFFGYMAGKRQVWAFVVGMILYAMDGMLFVWYEEWLSVGFHVFVLFCLYGGLSAAREMASIRRMVAGS